MELCCDISHTHETTNTMKMCFECRNEQESRSLVHCSGSCYGPLTLSPLRMARTRWRRANAPYGRLWTDCSSRCSFSFDLNLAGRRCWILRIAIFVFTSIQTSHISIYSESMRAEVFEKKNVIFFCATAIPVHIACLRMFCEFSICVFCKFTWNRFSQIFLILLNRINRAFH